MFGYTEGVTHTTRINTIAELGAARRTTAQSQANEVTLMAEAVQEGGSRRSVTADIALELSISQHQAGAEITRAIALTTRLPYTFAALSRGDIDLYKASKVVDPTLPLPHDLARHVDEI